MVTDARSERRKHFDHLVTHKHLIERSSAEKMALSIAERGTFYSEPLAKSKIPKMTESALSAALGDEMPADWQSLQKDEALDLFEWAIGRLA